MTLMPKCRPAACLAFVSILVLACFPATAGTDWPGWRGPHHDGAAAPGALDDGAARGLATAWKKALGSGYSSVSVAGSIAVTAFSDGEADLVAAFDAATGRELWRRAIGPTYRGHDGSHDGPISTPLIADGAVFVLGPHGDLVALDLATGEQRWRRQVVEDFAATAPYYGFTTSPIFAGGHLVVELGSGEGWSVAAFDPATGEQRWTAGGDKVSYQSPMVLEIGGEEQVLAVGDALLVGLDPATGEKLWEHPHGGDPAAMGGKTLNPTPAGEGQVLLTVRQNDSTLFAIRSSEEGFAVEEVWTSSAIKATYATPVYADGYFYGMSSRFLTCVRAADGEAVWKSRQPGDGFLILVDGHLVIVTKKGSLHFAEASPEGYREVAALDLFADVAWTPASFAGGALYARSLGEIARVDFAAAPASSTTTAAAVATAAKSPPLAGSAFAAFLARLAHAENKAAVIDAFLADSPETPFFENAETAYFFYRGEAEDVAIAGDWIGDRDEEPMRRIEGTDLFVYSTRLEPDARANYQLIVDFGEGITDPRNPRTTPSISGERSWFGMPEWRAPAHLEEPPEGHPRGRLEEVEVPLTSHESRGGDESDGGGKAGEARTRRLQVYLPAGYEDGEDRYPVAYVHWARPALEWGALENTLDNLVGSTVAPLIAVFVYPTNPREMGADSYLSHLVEAVVPYVDQHYRTVAEAAARATIGMGFAGTLSFKSAFAHPDVFGKVSGQSVFMLSTQEQELSGLVRNAEEAPLEIYHEWGKYDLRATKEGWDLVESNRRLAALLRDRGYRSVGGEVHDGFGWASWRNRTDRVFEALFPAER